MRYVAFVDYSQIEQTSTGKYNMASPDSENKNSKVIAVRKYARMNPYLEIPLCDQGSCYLVFNMTASSIWDLTMVNSIHHERLRGPALIPVPHVQADLAEIGIDKASPRYLDSAMHYRASGTRAQGGLEPLGPAPHPNQWSRIASRNAKRLSELGVPI
jgi:hypothetical protein